MKLWYSFPPSYFIGFVVFRMWTLKSSAAVIRSLFTQAQIFMYNVAERKLNLKFVTSWQGKCSCSLARLATLVQICFCEKIKPCWEEFGRLWLNFVCWWDTCMLSVGSSPEHSPTALDWPYCAALFTGCSCCLSLSLFSPLPSFLHLCRNPEVFCWVCNHKERGEGREELQHNGWLKNKI